MIGEDDRSHARGDQLPAQVHETGGLAHARQPGDQQVRVALHTERPCDFGAGEGVGAEADRRLAAIGVGRGIRVAIGPSGVVGSLGSRNVSGQITAFRRWRCGMSPYRLRRRCLRAEIRIRQEPRSEQKDLRAPIVGGYLQWTVAGVLRAEHPAPAPAWRGERHGMWNRYLHGRTSDPIAHGARGFAGRSDRADQGSEQCADGDGTSLPGTGKQGPGEVRW